jgi:hypothetical protein
VKTILAKKKFVVVVMRILVVKIVVVAAVVAGAVRHTKVVLGSWHLAACSF